MNTAGKVAVDVLTGATEGLVAEILISPDSGKRTREKMLGKSIDLRNKVNDSFGDVKKAYNRKVEAFAGEGKSGIDYLKDTLKV